MKVTCGEVFCKHNSGAEGKRGPYLRCKKKKIRLMSTSLTKPTAYFKCQDYEIKWETT